MAKARVLSLSQMRAKKFKYLEDLPQSFIDSFGLIAWGARIFIYGNSGNGKSSLIMILIELFSRHGKIMYLALEEGHSATTQANINQYLPSDFEGQIQFADITMTVPLLRAHLAKRNSPKIIFIDSVQYLDLDKMGYKSLVSQFKNKIFVFVSHADGRKPLGGLARDILYDADVKVFVKSLVAFVSSRFRGGKSYVIYEKGAKSRWGKSYRKALCVEGYDAPLPKVEK